MVAQEREREAVKEICIFKQTTIMEKKSLAEMTPEELIKAYIQAKDQDIKVIPQHAIDKAIGEIEELLIFLDVEPYPEKVKWHYF